MQPDDFDRWREELREVSVIVQDGDETTPQEEAERRFDRYMEMLDALDGSESDEVLKALLEGLTDQDDYGAYQRLYNVVASFPPERFGRVMAAELPSLIDRAPDHAGEFLLPARAPEAARAFNTAAERLAPAEREKVTRFIRAEEAEDGWLDQHPGMLCPPSDGGADR